MARLLYSIWTRSGREVSGLADPILSGRVDVLGDYVMMIHDNSEINELPSSQNIIDRVSSSQLTYKDFVESYMNQNKPVIITNIIDSNEENNWRVRSDDWLDPTKTRPNIKHIQKLFGDELVSVHEQEKAGFTFARPRPTKMTVTEFCDWWFKHHHEEEIVDENNKQLHSLLPPKILYLKDWKFLANFPSYPLYQCPFYFQNDWLNQYMNGAYKFVYLGPQGSCTRLHADVLGSYSWSTNICGQKRWYMIPPSYTYLLYDCFGHRLASHLHQDLDEGGRSSSTFYPGLKVARMHAIEVIQEATETIFVPSGWHHTVENMEPTLSVNHNWINETNISWSWQKVKREIDALCNDAAFRKSNEDGEEYNLCSSNNKDDSCSQVEDDLYLLWIIVSKKAMDTLPLLPHDNSNRKEESFPSIFRSIIPVLKGIQCLTNTEMFSKWKTRSNCHVDDLLKLLSDAKLF